MTTDTQSHKKTLSQNKIGLIKLNIDNNLIEDADYQEQFAIEYHRMFSDDNQNLCIILLPKNTIEYTFDIYGDRGFKSSGKSFGHNLHSFIYKKNEIYSIVIEAFLDKDDVDNPIQFVKFINIDRKNVDIRIKKEQVDIDDSSDTTDTNDTTDTTDDKVDSIKEEAKQMDNKNANILHRLQKLTQTTGNYDTSTGRKAYTVCSDTEDNEDGEDNEDDEDDTDDPYKNFEAQIDLLNDDIFNTDVEEILNNWDDAEDEEDEEDEEEVPSRCLFQNFQKKPPTSIGRTPMYVINQPYNDTHSKDETCDFCYSPLKDNECSTCFSENPMTNALL